MDRFTITREPEAPEGWWPRNKPFAFAVAGLATGLYLAGGCGSGSGAPPAPASPSSSAPASHTSTPIR